MMVQTFIIAATLLGLGFIGLAIQILFSKKKKFPDTHVGHNPEMRRFGITCVKTWDALEQRKVKQNINYKKIRLAD